MTPGTPAAPTISSPTARNLWLGTTTHSGNGSAISPPSVGGGGFDPDKTPPDTAANDVHLIFRLGGVGTTITLQKVVQGGSANAVDFPLNLIDGTSQPAGTPAPDTGQYFDPENALGPPLATTS